MPLNRGTLFDPKLVPELINRIKGKSSLAALAASEPVPFNGQKEFVFTMGDEANLVAESGPKAAGSVGLAPVVTVPVKIEYGARVSDEFMTGAEEYKIEILRAFSDGFAKKAARALDIMAFHGVNPRTNILSNLLTGKYFDSGVTVVYEGAAGEEVDANTLIETAIGTIVDYDVTGMAMAPLLRTKLSRLTLGDDNKQPRYPQLGWGQAPGDINGLPISVNTTVPFGGSTDLGILGDFQSAFKWGFAKEIPLKVIEYGCPDNDTAAGDLQGHNQVYLRCELYLGWAILDKDAFAVIRSGAAPSAEAEAEAGAGDGAGEGGEG